MTIAFVHNNKSFLPEMGAYVEYFSARGINCEVVKPQELKLLKPDVAWYFMGTNIKKLQGAVIIHEYTSASVGSEASAKNILKKWINAKPDYRIFLNEFVRASFNFNDDVPFGFRDMGVPREWLQQKPVTRKKNSFIYVGEWKDRNIELLLNQFVEHFDLQQFGLPYYFPYSLLILSKDYGKLQEKYKRYHNIKFEGPVSNAEVRQRISEAYFAINFIPDKEPYSRQTSTKLLEYAACNTRIISTDYAWVRQFQTNYGGEFYYLKPDASNFDLTGIHNFTYDFPDLTDWTWDKQIERSGVVQFLATKFPELSQQPS